MKPTLIRFPLDMLARLQRQAELKGVSLAELVRIILTKWLDGEYQNRSTIDTSSKT